MAKLKTINKWRANQTNILPIVGEVVFDKNATIEVDDNLVKELIELFPEFSLEGDSLEEDKGEDIKKKTEDQEVLEKEEGEDIEPQTESKDSATEDEVRKKLSELSVKEIKESYLSQFPEKETEGLKNKNQYIDYIVEQLVK